MFCTSCGTNIPSGQFVCPQCGRQMAQVAPPLSIMGFELERYRSHIKVLAIFWLVYGVLSLLLGLAALRFAHAYFGGGLPWMNGMGPHHAIPHTFLSMAMHVSAVALVVRSILAFISGWGLLENARWGRIVAIITAILCLIRVPLGTALGIWTLVMLFGYRHTMFYEQL